tara:strand:- start:42 stop:386 length:345 start_codon:yes stop_codon:yes gene_type:complete
MKKSQDKKIRETQSHNPAKFTDYSLTFEGVIRPPEGHSVRYFMFTCFVDNGFKNIMGSFWYHPSMDEIVGAAKQGLNLKDDATVVINAIHEFKNVDDYYAWEGVEFVDEGGEDD